ncbi:MAG: CoA transferase subunit A [Bacilli bacterium]
MARSKIFANTAEAIKDVKNGSTKMAGGFGLCGIPENLIRALRDAGTRNLTVISNNCGVDDWGLGLLLQNKQIKKMVSSYVGENKLFEEQFLNGSLEVELVPQGTLAERIRAGKAGIPAFYTATGVGTPIEEGKETKEFDGRKYVMEHSIKADFSIIKAWKSDTFGNLVFNKTARNFNSIMAGAGKITIVEVEEIVELGELNPDHIHVSGVYVNRIVQGIGYEKRIERLKTKPIVL